MRIIVLWEILTGGPPMPKEQPGFKGAFNRVKTFFKKSLGFVFALIVIGLIESHLVDR